MSDNHKNTITQTIKDYSRRLFSFIKTRVARTEDAEDILQEVFYQLAGNTKPVEQLSAWLFTVARNKITDNYRKKKSESLEDVFINGDDDDEFSWEEILFSSDNNPETEYIRSLVWPALQDALNELPEEQRETFVQHELNDISFDEMSKYSGISVPTLITRKRYAVLHLREKLKILKNELLNY